MNCELIKSEININKRLILKTRSSAIQYQKSKCAIECSQFNQPLPPSKCASIHSETIIFTCFGLISVNLCADDAPDFTMKLDLS